MTLSLRLVGVGWDVEGMGTLQEEGIATTKAWTQRDFPGGCLTNEGGGGWAERDLSEKSLGAGGGVLRGWVTSTPGGRQQF